MSRRQLVEAARSLGIRTEVVARGKRGVKDINWLRTDLLERCYGKNLGTVHARSAQELDDAVLRGVDCALGRLGYHLMVSQGSIREARDGLIEWKRLTELKRRRPKDEARLLESVAKLLKDAREAQDAHERERRLAAK